MGQVRKHLENHGVAVGLDVYWNGYDPFFGWITDHLPWPAWHIMAYSYPEGVPQLLNGVEGQIFLSARIVGFKCAN